MALFGKNKEIGSTQDALRFAEIRDGTVVLKDSNLRKILLCSSINFSLKSEQEQNAIIFSYQNFLNSLDFPIQILMQSKKLDLSNYLAKLDGRANEQTNELLRLQTTDYIEFIKRLINLANIMDKRFYVVVPYLVPPKMATPKIPLGKKEAPPAILSEDEFNQYSKEMDQRVQVIQSGLGSIGIRSALLNTQQIIELLYGVYNPEEASKQKFAAGHELSGEVVESEVFRPGAAAEGKEGNANAPAPA